MGRPAKADLDILISFETWMLVKNGELTFSQKELDNTELRTIHHFIGFDLGKAEKERQERKEEERRANIAAAQQRVRR
jgi:hypothetical protein